MWIKCLLLCLISMRAWGYNFTQDFTNGFYWASLPVKIMVIDENVSRRNSITNIAEAAISEWEQKTGLSIWDITTSGSTNILRWSTNFAAETRMDPSSVLAVAIRYTEGPYFARTEIVINGSHWLNQNQTNLKTTITHELGHTIGLDHSDNMLAVMAPSLQDPYRGLSFDDINGMKDAISQTDNRQVTRYVSPLAYTSESSSSQPLSCGTTSAPLQGASSNGLVSLGVGMLIGFVRKFWRWVKSLF